MIATAHDASVACSGETWNSRGTNGASASTSRNTAAPASAKVTNAVLTYRFTSSSSPFASWRATK